MDAAAVVMRQALYEITWDRRAQKNEMKGKSSLENASANEAKNRLYYWPLQ